MSQYGMGTTYDLETNPGITVTTRQIAFIHYNDIIMGTIASQITHLDRLFGRR